jgi:DNA helicase-2/ATP-dependent DNA helicase PcrA
MLKNYRLSASHLNDYLTCPRLFYYQDLLHVPQEKNRAVSFGTAVHCALKDITLTYNDTKQLPDQATFLELFEHYLERQLLSPKHHHDSLAFGKTILAEFYNHYQDNLQQFAFAERDFSTHEIRVGEVPIVGSIDRIELSNEANKLVHVVDYKTGSPDNKASKLGPSGDYRRQLLFYKLLCDLSDRFPYTMESGEIRFVQPSPKTGEFVTKKYIFTEENVTQLKATIQQVYRDIQALKFLELPEDAMCGDCKYCELFGKLETR